MNQQPLISIVVPVYNVEKYLGACVDSILNQTYNNIEIILVDDGSTDRSGEICDEYAQKNNNIRVIHCENKGPGEARNAGIDIMVGNYVSFVDSDDLIHDEMILRLYEYLHLNDADISTITLSSFGDNDCVPAVTKCKSLKIYEPGIEAVKSMLFQNGYIDNSPCGKLYRSELFKNQQFPNGRLYEDLATIPMVCVDAKKIVASKEVMYFYRRRATSILGKFTLQRYDVLDVADRLEQYMMQHHSTLVNAAQSRKFSANMNILYLMLGNGIRNDEVITRCWGNIKRLRIKMILNPHVRIKNKIGALLSFVGLDLLLLLFAKLKIKSNRIRIKN